MKTTLLVAMFAIASLTACEKTTVTPPATTVIQPTIEKQVAVPVGVPGPAGATGSTGTIGAAGAAGATGATGATGDAGATGAVGAPGSTGKPGEPGKAGDTVIVVPEKH